MITGLGLEKLGFVPEVDFTLRNDLDDRGVYIEKWLSKSPQPSESEIDKASKEAETEWVSQEYARNRKVEYDALNQFELMTNDAANGTTTHADAINAIKAKYPKG